MSTLNSLNSNCFGLIGSYLKEPDNIQLLQISRALQFRKPSVENQIKGELTQEITSLFTAVQSKVDPALHRAIQALTLKNMKRIRDTIRGRLFRFTYALTDEEILKTSKVSLNLLKGVFEHALGIRARVQKLVKIKNDNERFSDYENIAEILCSQNRFAEVMELAYMLPKDAQGDYILDYIFCPAFYNYNRFEEAFKIIETIEDKHSHSLALKNLVKALCSKDRLAEAITIADRIQDENVRADSLGGIAKTLFWQDRLEDAKKVAKIIPDKGQRSLILQDIFKALYSRKCFEEALEVAKIIPDEDIRSIALNDIFDIIYGKKPLEEVLKVAMMIPNESLRSTILNILCLNVIFTKKIYANEGPEGAKAVAMTIRNKGQRSSALLHVSETFCLHNRFEEALEVAKTIPDINLRLITLQKISASLCRYEKDLKKADKSN